MKSRENFDSTHHPSANLSPQIWNRLGVLEEEYSEREDTGIPWRRRRGSGNALVLHTIRGQASTTKPMHPQNRAGAPTKYIICPIVAVARER